MHSVSAAHYRNLVWNLDGKNTVPESLVESDLPWLELPLAETNFHGPNGVQAIKD